MTDLFWRCGLRVVFPIFRAYAFLLRPKIRSAHVLLRVDSRVLTVWHSYKKGWTAPAGMVRAGEDPAVGAARELREEVGVVVEVEALSLLCQFDTECEGARDSVHVFELRLQEEPRIVIDNREIVRAAFMDPVELGRAAKRPTFVAVLAAAGH